MANRTFWDPRTYQKELIFCAGIVALAADASISSQTGHGVTVAKTSTGLYTFTFDDQFYKVEFMMGKLVEAAVSALVGNFLNNYTTLTSQKLGTAQFKITNSSQTATDVSAVSEIHYLCGLRNTSVPR